MGRKRKITPTLSTHKGCVRARWTSDSGRHELVLGPADQPAVWQAAHAKLLQRLAADPNAPAGLPAGEYLVVELARDYLASTAVPELQRQQVRRALELLCDAHAETGAAAFGPVELEDWRDALCRRRHPADHPRRPGQPVYTTGHVGGILGVVKRCWRWGARRGRLPAAVWQALLAVPPPPRGAARDPAVVPPADDAAVDAALPFLTPPVAAMVRLQRLTGMRPSELFRLTPAQVLAGGKHTLPGAGAVDLDAEGVWVYLPEKHKTKHKGKHRVVPLGPAARAVLGPYLARGPEAPCFSPKEATAAALAARAAARQTPRYPSHMKRNETKRAEQPARAAGDRYTRQSYRQAVHRACDKAKVARWNPYQLRHSRASEIDGEMGLDAARAALGHDSAQTTTRYAKVSFKAAAKVARELG